MSDDALHTHTVSRAARLLRERQISPLELTRAYLERIERLDGHYRAYITVTADAALAAAEEATREIARGRWRGPLHGVPIAFKDLFAIRGVRLTCGGKITGNFAPDHDATAVAKLRAAGAILLGTLNLHEYAWGGTSINPHFGTPRNPWNPACIPGGSSGGSGVAVIAGLAAGSLGTDTGGSVRLPAALTGCVGLKPTYGRISRFGVFPLCWSFDHVGLLTRSVEDAALLLQVLAGPDPRDPTSSDAAVPDYPAALVNDLKGLRLAVPRDHFFDVMQPAVLEAFEAALRQLRALGATVEDVALPLMRYVPAASYVMMAAEAHSVHAATLRTRARDYGDDVRARLLLGGLIPAGDYLKAQRFRRQLRQSVFETLERVDAFVMPTTVLTATRIDQPTIRIGDRELVVNAHLSRCTRPFNMTGLPAISVPAGFSDQGLPIGLQIAGRPFGELAVLRIAHAYEQSTVWHTRRPADP